MPPRDPAPLFVLSDNINVLNSSNEHMHTFIFSFAAVTLCRIGHSSAELSQITGFLANCAHASHQLDKRAEVICTQCLYHVVTVSYRGSKLNCDTKTFTISQIFDSFFF